MCCSKQWLGDDDDDDDNDDDDDLNWDENEDDDDDGDCFANDVLIFSVHDNILQS